MNIIDILFERGFIEATTHDEQLRRHVQEDRPVTCYIGFDPTGSSLHVGHLVPVMALAHMQRNGHRPIGLVGGGTGLIGDPSGRTEMRQMLTLEQARKNEAGIKDQLSRFIDFGDAGGALMLNNADWLVGLKYIDFLRDIGKYFSVNRMLKSEGYRVRLESDEGLNFLEFNYMLLQAYDFLELYDRLGCRIQMGGSDQWGNIVAGIDLIRRLRRVEAYGITFPLVVTSSGAKMGKTAQGAVWLDAEWTSPYEYFQFWINTDDGDVVRFLSLFTFLPMEEINEAKQLGGAEINSAKAVLAFEATRLAHGEEAAVKAYTAAAGIFGSRQVPREILPGSTIPRKIGQADDDSSVPSATIDRADLEKGIPLFKLYLSAGLAGSGGEARRLIAQGGAYMNGNRVESENYIVTPSDIQNHEITLRAGKKKYCKIKIKT